MKNEFNKITKAILGEDKVKAFINKAGKATLEETEAIFDLIAEDNFKNTIKGLKAVKATKAIYEKRMMDMQKFMIDAFKAFEANEKDSEVLQTVFGDAAKKFKLDSTVLSEKSPLMQSLRALNLLNEREYKKLLNALKGKTNKQAMNVMKNFSNQPIKDINKITSVLKTLAHDDETAHGLELMANAGLLKKSNTKQFVTLLDAFKNVADNLSVDSGSTLAIFGKAKTDNKPKVRTQQPEKPKDDVYKFDAKFHLDKNGEVVFDEPCTYSLPTIADKY